MNRAGWWIVVLLAWSAMLGAAYYYWWVRPAPAGPPVEPPIVEQQQAAPPAARGPEIRHPIDEARRPEAEAGKAAAPLPPLEDSDRALEETIASLIGRAMMSEFLHTQTFVRRLVATIDSLPQRKSVQRLWPAQAPEGRFLTQGVGEVTYISPANYQRYAPFMRLLDGVDAAKLVSVYVRAYPLFQQAYVELGYPQGYFNDRLIEVIDHLLATPEVDEPIKLTRPWVLYEFADPALEARSAGQKLLLRIGSANAAKVKAKLREIRRQVVARPKEH